MPFSRRDHGVSSGGEEAASQFNFNEELHSRLLKKADTLEMPSFMEAWESGINDELDNGDCESVLPFELGELLNVDEKVISNLLKTETWNRISSVKELGSPD